MKSLRAWCLVSLLLLPAGCGGGAQDEEAQGRFVEIGDMAEIRERGSIRVLIPDRRVTSHFPRKGHVLDFEPELIESFARLHDLETVWIRVASREELIPQLLGGKGDVIAANLTASPERKRVVDFTVPVALVKEQLVARVNDEPIRDAVDLARRRIAVRHSSSFRDTVERLWRKHPAIEIEEVPEDVDTEEIIHRVATGTYDLTVADSNLVEACLQYRDDIRAALDLTPERAIAMAVRPGSSDLLDALNRFLTEAQLSRRGNAARTGDLEEINRRGVLRVLTRNAAATYFLWRGRLRGFEYELAREFARRHHLRLEMIVPPSNEDLLAWLVQGRGDVVASALTPTDERRSMGVAFSRRYNEVSEVVVARADDEGLDEPADLEGREIWVRPSSSYRQTLERLREDGLDFVIRDAPEEQDTEEIIARVAEGEYDLTLSDSHILAIELTWRDDVRAAFPVREKIPLAWAVRETNPELKQAIDEFFREEYRGLFYNVVYERYFEDPHKIRRRAAARASDDGSLSPYDEIVKRYAGRYGFDWRLIVSQMYQESRFDPRARSFAGARGLMQVLPQTAEEFGLSDLDDPETAIHAGVRYLHWVRGRFEEELHVRDRMWFALAAYNAGPGHVRDARRIAAKMGLNPNRWFDNVERAMLLLSRREYANAAQHGYCRCIEPVQYVREIQTRYNAYVETIGT